ncbi:MAG: metalloregulator ArsR/SmtB family transcription factor [Candidatus Pacebacteria bacterium]|nr:metalloregulator ArsR/SmtB family transcription factor [Candidatus Paceibacterota bacterium]
MSMKTIKNKKKICPSCLGLIGENTRVKIIQELKEKPQNVSKIADCFRLTQPTISHHLRALEEIGMISGKKAGREIYYSLNKNYPCKNCQIFKLPFKIK